jgi:hypothetical protein
LHKVKLETRTECDGKTSSFDSAGHPIFDLGLPIYDLAAGGPKLQMKSNAKDEVKKERPDTTPASQ